jgi:RNA methyltransferase, TrmH family
VEAIRSRANPRLKALRRLQAKRHRLAAGLFVAEGEDIVEEGLAAGILPVESFAAAERPPDEALLRRLGRGGPLHLVEDALLAEAGSLGHPARLLAVFRIEDLPGRGDGDLGLYLHRVIDPGNVGTVVRAAGALGPAFVALSPGCSDPLSGKGVRASMGAVFRVPVESPAELPATGTRAALVAHGGEPLWAADLTGPIVFAVGAERHGLPPEIVEACELRLSVPQAAGAESLNAAAAATIALYEAVRQRAAARARNTESASPAAGGRRSNQPKRSTPA